jgi:hypothetical protein
MENRMSVFKTSLYCKTVKCKVLLYNCTEICGDCAMMFVLILGIYLLWSMCFCACWTTLSVAVYCSKISEIAEMKNVSGRKYSRLVLINYQGICLVQASKSTEQLAGSADLRTDVKNEYDWQEIKMLSTRIRRSVVQGVVSSVSVTLKEFHKSRYESRAP